jgi:hypothetical protein
MHVGTLQESSLHADLKAWYAQPGDRIEARVEGFVIDIVRGDLMIEIQTGNFSALKAKLNNLLLSRKVLLIYPIAEMKWILRLGEDKRTEISRRKSPKQGSLVHLFAELVRIPDLISIPDFSLELIFIHEEEIWVDDGKGSWRRKGWSIYDRRLIKVLSTKRLSAPEDFRALLPESLPAEFSTADLAVAMAQPRYLAQKMAYCLRRMGVIKRSGKRGKSWLYSIRR